MAEPSKICPICDTRNYRNAMVCSTCGTTLSDVPATDGDTVEGVNWAYDYQHGETDLLEDSVRGKAQAYLAGIVVFLTLMMCSGLALILSPMIQQISVDLAPPTSIGVEITSTTGAFMMVTNTPRAPLVFATVTEGPPTLTPTERPSLTPTITPTPTRTPCMQTVGAGEGLYSIVARCGHRSLDVIPLVVDLNDLNNDTDIFPGQSLQIPWPTDTPSPDATPEPEAGAQGVDIVASIGTPSDEILTRVSASITEAAAIPTQSELPPGLMFHSVRNGEDISNIVYDYNTSLEVLSQINPEVTFSQCDFGIRLGGPRCIVLIFPGQRIRVPAPTPTPTLSPTPSGSETPTPTATATFNAPNAVSPSNRAYIRRDEFVTLRWNATGTLAPGQVYRVTVENITTDTTHTADTTDLFFVLPRDWQGVENQRYEYRWTVSVIDSDNPENPYFTTQPLTFTWEGQNA